MFMIIKRKNTFLVNQEVFFSSEGGRLGLPKRLLSGNISE